MSRLASFFSGSENRQRLNSVLIAKRRGWSAAVGGRLFYICKFFFSLSSVSCINTKIQAQPRKERRMEGCVRVATANSISATFNLLLILTCVYLCVQLSPDNRRRLIEYRRRAVVRFHFLRRDVHPSNNPTVSLRRLHLPAVLSPLQVRTRSLTLN